MRPAEKRAVGEPGADKHEGEKGEHHLLAQVAETESEGEEERGAPGGALFREEQADVEKERERPEEEQRSVDGDGTRAAIRSVSVVPFPSCRLRRGVSASLSWASHAE